MVLAHASTPHPTQPPREQVDAASLPPLACFKPLGSTSAPHVPPTVPTGRAPAALILLLVSIAQISEVLRIPANNYDAIPRRGPPRNFF